MTSGDDNRTDSESGFRCVAANSVLNRTESELGQIIFAGPPGPPGNFSAVNTTSDSTVLVWAAPVSDVPLTNYTLDIVQIQSLSSLDFTAVSGLLIAADQLSVEIRPPFRPDSLYSAELTANSRAGAGSAVAVIRTPEAGLYAWVCKLRNFQDPKFSQMVNFRKWSISHTQKKNSQS